MTAARAFRDRVVLVTGAASGIGRATALAFAEGGAALELVDRDEAGLNGAREAVLVRGAKSAATHHTDVSCEAAVAELGRRIHERVGAVDVLVNAAGVALIASFFDTSAEDWEWILGVNLWGAIHTSRVFAPGMIARGAGHIVNVASAAAFFAPDELLAYGVSKAALVSLSETLREELAPHRVGVSVVCPGFVDTPIIANARLRGGFALQGEAIRGATTGRGLPPARVAAAILEAVLRDQRLVPVAREAWCLYLLKRLTPSLLPALVQRYRARQRP